MVVRSKPRSLDGQDAHRAGTFFVDEELGPNQKIKLIDYHGCKTIYRCL